jgi:outer membrane receptor protein involved in Fe transport
MKHLRFFDFKRVSALWTLIQVVVMLAVVPHPLAAQKKKEFKDFRELNIEDLLNQEITIATKSKQKISEAPSIVTIITAEEIKNMGARSLRDILEIVPGFEFSRQRIGAVLVGIRGTKDPRGTAKLLFLVDGVPYNTLMYGLSLFGGYELNMDAVERIEVIRGPGSALYGRNAFNGVVNVITKSAINQENSGLQFTALGGNYNTWGGGVSYGMKKEKLDLYFNLMKLSTDGHEPLFDNGMGGTSPWELYQDNFYLNVKANLGKLEFSGFYTDREYGSSHGPFVTNSYVKSQRGSYFLKYHHSFSKKLEFTSRIIGQHLREVQNIEVFKPGLPPPFGLFWPKGRYAQPQYEEYKYGLEAEFRYQFSENHHLLAGIQLERYGVDDCRVRANYDLDPQGTGAALINPVTGDYYGKDDMPEYPGGWILDYGHDYHNLAFFIQDTFYLAHNFGITIGGRYDNDSEFGGVFNPRGGIVWEFAKNVSLKLLYGQAYRAPNCQEQFKTNGFAIGNVDLKPEKIKTFEIGLGCRFKKVSTGINFFYNKLHDVIYVEPEFVGEPNTYQNIGENIARGFEVENRFILNKNFSMFLNYSYTRSEDKRDDQTTPHIDVAPHKLNCGVNVGFLRYFNFNTTLIYRSEREKYPGILYDVGPHTLLNVTLISKDIIKNLEISASVYNVFNKKYYDQEPNLLSQPYQPGRSFMMKLIYKF